MKHVNAIALLTLIVAVSPVQAQFRECGTVVSDRQMAAERAQIEAGELPTLPVPVVSPFHLPMTIHICRKSNGTGGMTPAAVDSAMRYLNLQYVPVGIQFFQYGSIIYIDNDFFYRIPDSDIARNMLRQQQVVANNINVYFTLLDNLCGQSSFPADDVQGVLMDSACAGSVLNTSTFAHEVGHYLDLYHTHETQFGTECPNGSNCATTGDLLCDTPADPDLSDSVNAACVWTGTATLPPGCGSTPYAPQTNNLMSYSSKTCRNLFTPGQINRMLNTMGGSRLNLHTNVKYVDRDWTGAQNGTPQEPYATVAQALSAAAFQNFIFIKSASYPGALTSLPSNTLIQLHRWNASGTVVIGQ